MMTPEEIEEAIKTITDDLRTVDKILKARGMGVDMVPAFRCGHSGLWLPVDYIKEWGRLYGIGLGPSPVSEVLDTEYDIPPPDITPEIRDISQIMHPVGNSKAQVDFDLVQRDVYEANRAICAIDDPYMVKRGMLVRGKQLKNPRGRLRTMEVMWEKVKTRASETEVALAGRFY